MIEDQAELALDLSNMIGGLPLHGYVVISNMPCGSRLSHGYDSGDNTWTLMVDDLPGLKFLPGPVRGIVSLRAQIFDPAASGVGQTTKELPLVLHTADASQFRAPENKVEAGNTTAASIRKDAKQGGTGHTSAEARENPNAGNPNPPSLGGKPPDLVSRPKDGMTAPMAQRESTPQPAAIGQEDAVPQVLTSARGVAEPPITRQKFWGADAERRFTDAVAELRREADAVLHAAERRHRSEVEELSRANTKQHELIATLRKEAEQVAHRHREAERSWQTAEAARMKTAQDAWAREKEALKREAILKEQEFASQLKKTIVDTERLMVKSRTEYENAVLRRLSETEKEIRAIFQTKTGQSSGLS